MIWHAAEQRRDGDGGDQHRAGEEPARRVMRPRQPDDHPERNDRTDHEAGGEAATGAVVAGEEEVRADEERKGAGSPNGGAGNRR